MMHLLLRICLRNGNGTRQDAPMVGPRPTGSSAKRFLDTPCPRSRKEPNERLGFSCQDNKLGATHLAEELGVGSHFTASELPPMLTHSPPSNDGGVRRRPGGESDAVSIANWHHGMRGGLWR